MRFNKQIGNSAFADGFVRSTLYFGLIHLTPYLLDNEIPMDGCAYIGFPMIFFTQCYWSGVHFEQTSLYVDIVVWIIVSCIVGARWRRIRTHSNKEKNL